MPYHAALPQPGWLTNINTAVPIALQLGLYPDGTPSTEVRSFRERPWHSHLQNHLWSAWLPLFPLCYGEGWCKCLYYRRPSCCQSKSVACCVLGGKKGTTRQRGSTSNFPFPELSAVVIGPCQRGMITAWHRNQKWVFTSAFALRWDFERL